MRPEKKAIVDELRNHVSGAVFVILTDYRGLNVEQTNALRERLGKVNAEFRVVRNRLFRHMAQELDYKEMEAGLEGPSAMVFGGGDVVEAAKILKAFVKEHELPVVKLGVLRGVVLSADELRRMADLPSRPVLLGQLVGTLAAPMHQVVGVLQQKLASLIYVLRAVQEKKEN